MLVRIAPYFQFILMYCLFYFCKTVSINQKIAENSENVMAVVPYLSFRKFISADIIGDVEIN